MSANSGPPQQIGSDESFISFAFAIVSAILLVLYLTWIINFSKRIYEKFSSGRRRSASDDEYVDPVVEVRDGLLYLPRLALMFIKSPRLLVGGYQCFAALPRLAVTFYTPKFLYFVLRPKIFFFWLWIILLSSVMYQSLTFDAYGILGLPASASTGDVKKAYRQLSKIYHPDQNKTEEARVLYNDVRRAYKSLVNREAYEEEISQEVEFSVGIALPKFLTSRDNETVVLFSLLALLIAGPSYVWYKFSGNDGNKVAAMITVMKKDKDIIESFFQVMGIPKDSKYTAKLRSRQEILKVLKQLGLVQANATENVVSGFPTVSEFMLRCMTPEKHKEFFVQLGFDEEGVRSLNQYALENSETISKQAELYEQEDVSNKTTPPFQPVSQDTYRTARYLLTIHMGKVDEVCSEVQRYSPQPLRNPRKLVQLHQELLKLLEFVMEREKPLQRHQLELILIPQEAEKIVGEVEPEVVKNIQKYYKQNLIHQFGKRAVKSMSRKGQPPPNPQS